MVRIGYKNTLLHTFSVFIKVNTSEHDYEIIKNNHKTTNGNS